MNNGGDCEHGKRVGDCIYCEHTETLTEQVTLQEENRVLREDLIFFIEQSITVEYKQDHDRMLELRKKYGYYF